MNRVTALILVYLLIISNALAGLPPTTMKGLDDASPKTTFNFQTPHSQATRINATTALIETGNTNSLPNPSFESQTFSTGWTVTTAAGAVETTEISDGKKSAKLTFTATTGDIAQSFTPAEKYAGNTLEAGCNVKTALSTIQVCQLQGGVEVNCVPVTGDSNFHYTAATAPAPSSGSVGIRVKTSASTTGVVYVDDCYVGKMKSYQVSQAQLVGGVVIAGCSANWTTTSASISEMNTSAPTGCTYTPFPNGVCSAPLGAGRTAMPGLNCGNLPPGEYKLEYEGTVGSATASSSANFQFWDGTNVARETSVYSTAATGGTLGSALQQSITYTTPQTSVTFTVRGKASAGTALITGTTANPGVIRVYRYPTASEQAIRIDQAALSYSGYLAGSWTQTAAMSDYAAGSGVSLTQLSANGLVPTAMAGSLPGLTFTPPRAGKARVCAVVQATGSNTNNQSHRLIDTNGAEIVKPTSLSTGTGLASMATLCGQAVIPSTASYGIKLQAGANTQTITIQNITWSLEYIDQGLPAPLLIGGLSTGSPGAEHTERYTATAACTTGTCTAATKTSGISSVAWTATGNYQVNFSPAFSAVPTCTCICSTNTSYCSVLNNASTSLFTFACTFVTGGVMTAVNSPFNVQCQGPQ